MRRKDTVEKLAWLAKAVTGVAYLVNNWDYLEISYEEEQDAYLISASFILWGDYEWNEMLSVKGLDQKAAAKKLLKRIFDFDPRKQADWNGIEPDD